MLIETNQNAFDAIRTGLEVGEAMMPIDPNGPEMLLPYLAPYRAMGRLMAMESRMYEEEGNYSNAFDNYLSILDFGNQLPRGGLAINGLVGYAVNGTALEGMRWAIEDMEADPDEYRFLGICHRR